MRFCIPVPPKHELYAMIKEISESYCYLIDDEDRYMQNIQIDFPNIHSHKEIFKPILNDSHNNPIIFEELEKEIFPNYNDQLKPIKQLPYLFDIKEEKYFKQHNGSKEETSHELEMIEIPLFEQRNQFTFRNNILIQPNFDKYEETFEREFITENLIPLYVSKSIINIQHYEPLLMITKKRENDTFLQTLMIPIVKFDLKPIYDINAELENILNKIEEDEHIYEQNNENNLCKEIEIPMNLYEAEEIYSPIVSRTNLQENIEIPKHNETIINDNLFNVPNLPIYLIINKNYFDENDINSFSSLFNIIKIKTEELETPILMQLNNEMVFILYITQNDNILNLITQNLKKFKVIIIISIFEPLPFQTEFIKWRCITSNSHIPFALIPFLLQKEYEYFT